MEAPAARGVPILYVNVNPSEHNAETLQSYQRRFGDRLIFTHGSRAQLIHAARAFHASFYVPDPDVAGEDAELEHTDAIYLVDERLQVRVMYLNSRRELPAMLDDLRRL